MAKQEFIKDDYFKIDCECHLSGDKEYINYFPGVQQWWRGVDNVRGAFGARGKRPISQVREGEKVPEEDRLIGYMDRYGVDMTCLLPEAMMDTTGYATRWSTNGYIAAVTRRRPFGVSRFESLVVQGGHVGEFVAQEVG